MNFEKKKIRMKLKTQDTMTVNVEPEEIGIDEINNGNKNISSNLHISDADKEKGNYKNFNISKRTIKKLQSKSQLR